MDRNRVAFQAGQDVPNTITAQFFDLWIYMGGSGATLALVVGMLLFARSQQLKSLGDCQLHLVYLILMRW